ncbi:MAG TPA: hypothetical protein EYP58_02850 [bacterium (Candidatus Stahlbacteria)]|nr:hypothetical protein [Candidatus Stahlbacteria bacterium]
MKLVLATLLVLSSFPLLAGGKEEVAAELDRTDLWISKASEVVSKALDGPTQSKAVQLLDFARNLQSQARVRYNMRHYQEALKLTRGARQAARRSLEIALGFELTPDNVKRTLNRTDELITKASGLIQEAKNQKVNELYRIALDTQKSARESFQNNRLLIALKLTLSARRMVMRLIRMAQEMNADQVSRELKITDRLIGRIKKADKRIEQAKELQKNAYDHFHNNRFIQAYRLTKQVQKLVYSVLKEIETVDREEVKRAIEETEHLLGLADINAASRGQIHSLLSEARRAYEEGQYREALIKTSAAKRLLDKTIEE